MTAPTFVHLRVHSEYSLVDSVVRVKPLVERARSLDMPALALTDEGNVSAMVKFYRAAVRSGIKPLLGADVWVGEADDDSAPTRLALLCMNERGFRQLCRLLTDAHAKAPVQGRWLIDRAWLAGDCVDGLIALSGGQLGDIGRTLMSARPERAAETLARWRECFPDRFYIEVQRLGRVGEDAYLDSAVRLAAEARVPLVATNEVCFLEPDEFEAHEARVCIAHGRTLADPSRPASHTREQHLKSAAAMAERFADLPEALANSVEIAKRCNFELSLGEILLPTFELPEGRTADVHLREQAERGLADRLSARDPGEEERAVYRERLAHELGVICQMGFEGYFLIVSDFIGWAREHRIPVGPGRGSGAGSLVAYALGITDLDPLEHDLLFERFLNPERVSMPDFDIDFCIEGRDRVIEYVSQRYGRDRVSQIITYGTMAARAVVRDVGRVLGHPYGYVDRIAKLIPFELGITLDRALAEDEELRGVYESEEEVRLLIDLARQLEGLARNAGTHAGGVVIAPSPLTESMPLYADPASASLTQLDKDDLEAIGLVKFDFLGLKTLTIIDKALANVNRARAQAGEPPIDVNKLPLDDREAYALLNRCQTTAVFQLESRGMKDLVKRLKPDRFEDLVAILALFRPGPLQSGMVDEFIDRKHGRNAAPIDYLDPSLEDILQPTYGVILYQEQVMQIAQVLAGYSLGSADLLRRAMGKKKPEEMAKQREIFLQGASERAVDPERAAHIFDLMEKFAGYGFNKSHSAAYALLAFQTAWLKAHYPEAFMASVMTADMDNTDKLVILKDDCKQLGIRIDPPSVNRSSFEFAVSGPKQIIYGLGAIKGVGQSVVEAIISEREAGGPFTGLLDLCLRIDPHKVNRRVLEALTRSGALDELGGNRRTLMNAIADTLALAERSVLAAAAGQGALFEPERNDAQIDYVIKPLREWSKHERLEAERESLGLYLTGHPFDDYAEHCRNFSHGAIAKVLESLPATAQPYHVRKNVILAGAVMDIRRRGNRTALLLDDNTERIEVTLFDEVYAQSKHLISKHVVLVIEGQLRYDDFLSAWRLTAQRVRSVDSAIEEHARCITISLSDEETGLELIGQLKETLAPFRHGACEVSIRYRNQRAAAQLVCGEGWCVRPTRELRESLSRLLGEDRYAIHYPKHFV